LLQNPPSAPSAPCIPCTVGGANFLQEATNIAVTAEAAVRAGLPRAFDVLEARPEFEAALALAPSAAEMHKQFARYLHSYTEDSDAAIDHYMCVHPSVRRVRCPPMGTCASICPCPSTPPPNLCAGATCLSFALCSLALRGMPADMDCRINVGILLLEKVRPTPSGAQPLHRLQRCYAVACAPFSPCIVGVRCTGQLGAGC
jgi:hypothetical protein